MVERRKITVDGNEAAASVAYRTSEVIAIYPITTSAVMGELSEEWSVQGKKISGVLRLKLLKCSRNSAPQVLCMVLYRPVLSRPRLQRPKACC